MMDIAVKYRTPAVYPKRNCQHILKDMICWWKKGLKIGNKRNLKAGGEGETEQGCL
jgi:hypothetical protein